MKKYKKHDFPVEKIRRFLEPGPIVLVSSAWKDEMDIMTMGWHMVMEFVPSQIGCIISAENYSFELIRKSKECVINIPTFDLINQVIGVGNTHGNEVNKFEKFNLTPAKAQKVKAPLIEECYANYECKLVDSSLVNKYNMFIFEVVKAHVAKSPKYPKTIHYRGEGIFMIAGSNRDYLKKFTRKGM